jgi:hypothetical protein
MSPHDDVDRDALERALALAQKMPGRARQIAGKLEEEPRLDVMRFAASCCQDEALRLSPHQLPPADIDPAQIDAILAAGPDGNFYGAAALLRRMLRVGLSQFEPDPVGALRRLEARLAS